MTCGQHERLWRQLQSLRQQLERRHGPITDSDWAQALRECADYVDDAEAPTVSLTDGGGCDA